MIKKTYQQRDNISGHQVLVRIVFNNIVNPDYAPKVKDGCIVADSTIQPFLHTFEVETIDYNTVVFRRNFVSGEDVQKILRIARFELDAYFSNYVDYSDVAVLGIASFLDSNKFSKKEEDIWPVVDLVKSTNLPITKQAEIEESIQKGIKPLTVEEVTDLVSNPGQPFKLMNDSLFSDNILFASRLFDCKVWYNQDTKLYVSSFSKVNLTGAIYTSPYLLRAVAYFHGMIEAEDELGTFLVNSGYNLVVPFFSDNASKIEVVSSIMWLMLHSPTKMDIPLITLKEILKPFGLWSVLDYYVSTVINKTRDADITSIVRQSFGDDVVISLPPTKEEVSTK